MSTNTTEHTKQVFWIRVFWIFTVSFFAVFTGYQLTVQKAILMPFPGTATHSWSESWMKGITYTTVFVVFGTALKFVYVRLVGPKIEQMLGTNRPVRIRDISQEEIRWTAFWGGFLNAIYSVLFIMFATLLAPTTLAAAKACVLIPLAILEVGLRILPRTWKMIGRLIMSSVITIAGAFVVIFSNGFDLFKGDGTGYMWLFLILVGPGNFCLALAEMAETKGADYKNKTAASVYTLARAVAFSLICIAATLIWGAISHGYGMIWPIIQMCADRWPLFLILAILWGLVDQTRISSKTVISTTFIYIVGSLSVVINAVMQWGAQHLWPQIYTNVPQGGKVFILWIIGGAVISIGTLLFPQPERKDVIKEL